MSAQLTDVVIDSAVLIVVVIVVVVADGDDVVVDVPVAVAGIIYRSQY